MYKVFLDAPNIGEIEKKYLTKAIDDGFVSTVGPFVEKFEEKFANFLKVKNAVSTQSGTSAIHMALYELGIGKGDEVIVPVLTFVATVNPVIYVNAKPVFVDVDINTWNIDPKEIKKNITKKTKAIIPVHLYGNPCNMDEIMDIAKKYNLYVVEAATESLGAKYNSKYTGTFGDFGCFSFNGNKIITTGGGGMIIGNDENSLEHIKFLVNQAKDKLNDNYHTEIGFNYRMTNIESALGLAQMKRLNEFLKIKKLFNKLYREELGKFEFVKFQEEYKEAESSYWFTAIKFEKDVNIEKLQNNLKEKSIQTRRTFMPVVEFPPYNLYKIENYKNSYYIYNKGLCLPCSTLNSKDDVYYICKIIKNMI